jgi:mortality factor 4-like protein 1
MPPSKAAVPPYTKDERVLCFHHEMLYEAKILDLRQVDDKWSYKIHYKGWKNTWDDWVPQDRIRKFTDENKELAAQLHAQMKLLQQKSTPAAAKTTKKGGRANGSDFSSARGSEERHVSTAAQSGKGSRRNRDYELETEDAFHSRPSIKLLIPDHLKAILVDDWENVTKNQQLVPLPSENPVNKILADYVAFESPKRVPGSPEADILEEVIAGLREYFEKCLGRILLYRFERNQYLDVRELWNLPTGDMSGKTAGDTYGAEHFCRLLVTLPELIAQTNMDQQSVNRLREELLKMTNWLAKNATTYFAKDYETPSQAYIEKARGTL